MTDDKPPTMFYVGPVIEIPIPVEWRRVGWSTDPAYWSETPGRAVIVAIDPERGVITVDVAPEE